MSKNSKSLKLNEDWTSTLMGGLVILLVILVYSIKLAPWAEFSWPKFSWTNTDELVDKVFAIDNLGHILIVFAVSYALIILANYLLGRTIKQTYGFLILFILTIAAMAVGGNKFLKDWGLETVIFSLLIGLFISNIFTVPDWIKGALTSEMYVKIGLVLLGTNIIFGDMMRSGALGLIQSVIVVFGVWYFSFWFCKKLKIDEEMAIMLSSAVSICGVSAAVASAGAIKGDPKKLSYVVSLVMVVAVPMIIIMPFLAKLLGLSGAVAGAWIGGTIDTTGAVVAAGAILGTPDAAGVAADISAASQEAIALKTSSVVKFSQNVLLGIAAFLISIYWTYNKGKREANAAYAEKPSAKLIWERFPKFVLGFVLASLVFSFILDPAENKPAMDTLKKMQGLWFALAFTSIGLETNFRTLINTENRKATLAFLTAQGFNVIFTLIIASIVFGIDWGI